MEETNRDHHKSQELLLKVIKQISVGIRWEREESLMESCTEEVAIQDSVL